MRLPPTLTGRGVTLDRVLLVFVAVVVTLAAASDAQAVPDDQARPIDALALGLLAVAVVVIIVAWRRAPAAAAMGVLGLTFTWYATGYTSGLINLATLAAFYRLGTSDGQAAKVAVAGLAVLATVVNMAVFGGEPLGVALEASGYVVMAVLFGELIRNRRLVIDQFAQRAARAEADAARRVAQERLAIARDVHDVLAHSVAAMTVQAGVAADALDRDRDETAAAIENIRSAGRRAMGEIRSTVAVLRSGTDATTADRSEPRTGVVQGPAPGIDRLEELVDAAEAQGLQVALRVALPEHPLPELVELTAFRVVQEALTNVVRHAEAEVATVTVEGRPGELTVEIRDDGRRADTDRPVAAGYGLRGMAERVESIGGTLHHGPDGHGWTVRASLPVSVGAGQRR